jgi:hypothetical protein
LFSHRKKRNPRMIQKALICMIFRKKLDALLFIGIAFPLFYY